MKLKEKIKNWLFKEEIKELTELKKNYDKYMSSFEKAKALADEARDMHRKSYDLTSDCRKFMNSICDVGTDVGFKSSDHSWAVICVHGKMDYVKFVDMNHRDVMEIASFLKKFEYSNRVTDSPLYKIHIEDMIKRL